MATGFDGMWQTFLVRCHRMVIFRCFGVQGILRWLQSFVWLIGLPPLRNDCCLVDDIRGLKQSGRQRQVRLRLKNECLPLIRISKMAAFLLIRRHLNFSITYRRSIEFQMEIKIICCRGFGSQTTQIVVTSRCCFAWDC